MEAVLPRSWKEEFAQAAAVRREDLLYREKQIRFETKEREKREEEQKDEKEKDQENFAAALAPLQEVAEFRVQLDDYDTKTVESLMDNREALEAIHHKINDMLDEAEVLPDGRRVFKTKDGTRVFDEHGEELSAKVIDPSAIDDKKPRWETFKAVTDERVRLTEERQQLLDYQSKLDEARDRLDKGDITQKELNRIKTDLSATMPDAVREKLDLEKPKTDATVNASPPAMPDELDSLMRKTGFAPISNTP